MELVRDAKTFMQELSRFKKKHTSFYTNFFKFIDEINKLVYQRRLAIDISDGCFLIFEFEKEYYQLYYCVDSASQIPTLCLDKTLATWVISSKKTNKKDTVAHKKMLMDAGFSYDVRNLQFSLMLNELEPWLKLQKRKYLDQMNTKRYEVGFLRENEAGNFEVILSSAFPYYRIEDIPFELVNALENRNIMVIRDKIKDNLIAFMYMEFRGKMVHTKKICVDKAYRGMGFGKFIMISSLLEAISRGSRRWLVEVDESNKVSLNLHGCMPLQETGIVADLFLKI